MPAPKLLARFAPVALAAVLLAGCGAGGDDDSSTTTTGGDTTTTTSDTPTTSGGDPTETVQQAVEASIDESRQEFTIDATLEGMGQNQTIGYDGVADLDADVGEATYTGPNGELDARVIGSDTYLRADVSGWSRALNGRKWLVVQEGDIDGIGTLADLDTGRNVLYRLLNVSNVEEEGTEDDDGTEVQTYRFELDAEVSDDVPSDRRTAVESLLRATGSGVLTIEGTLAVGVDDGLIHAVELDGGVRAPGDDESDEPRIEIGYDADFEYPEEVDIEEPPAADTIEPADAPRAVALIRTLQGG